MIDDWSTADLLRAAGLVSSTPIIDTKKAPPEVEPSLKGCRRRPTLPRPLGRSTIGAAGLNARVRNGNGCGPCALVASVKADIGSSSDRMI